jgi:membrane protease YdiL (CAAX protease family)
VGERRATFSVMPTPADGLILLPVAATLGIWALYLSGAGPSLIGWGRSEGGALWSSWLVQLSPLVVGLAALALWLSVNGWDWANLGFRMVNWRRVAVGAGVGVFLALINLAVITVIEPWLSGERSVGHAFFYQTPHARPPWWLMLGLVVPVVAVVIETLFRGFLLGRLLVWVPTGWMGRWTAITGGALLFAWDPFLVMSFHEWHWLGWSDGIVWGALFVRTGTLLVPMAAHGVEVATLYAVFRWVLA